MVNLEEIEEWADIPGFSRYQISTEGRIFNKGNSKFMKFSPNNFGHPKISLLADSGYRNTRSVAFLVAKTFLIPPNPLCDRIIYLDGNLENVRAANLAWRPRSFGWKYSRQMKVPQPAYFKNLPVINLDNNAEYENIIQAGLTEGLLFSQIWHSTYSGDPVFPYGSTWAVLQ